MANNINEGLEPRLVMMDNLGEANSSPSEYTLLWWMQQILIALGGGAGTIPFDIQGSLTDIDNSAYTDLVTLNIGVGEIVQLSSVTCTLIGFSAHYIVEYYDGATVKEIRHYLLNTQQPTFSDVISADIKLPYVGAGSYIKVKARMNGVNHQGKAFACLNGSK